MKTKKKILMSCTFFLCLVVMGPPVWAKTEWQQVGEGQLEIRTADLQSPEFELEVPLLVPLKRTDVKIQFRGYVAEVTVSQEFKNDLNRPIEAEYVFPLPQNAAVNHTHMRIGDRIIEGRIARRQEARQRYEQARDTGRRASLLEQERPNIFTQSVANIASGEEIHVVIRYVQPVEYVDGEYKIVYPMVVGPRYIPGQAFSDLTAGMTGHGRLPDTDQVPDASRITPWVLKPGERCGMDIQVQVDIDAGVPIQKIWSPSHRVTVDRKGESKAMVTLDPSDRIPNKDFVLNVEIASEQPEAGVLTHHDGTSGYYMLILQPPVKPEQELVRPREIILVLDCSGSMQGQPIHLVKEAAKGLLGTLRPTDQFNILSFNTSATAFSPQPLPATPSHVQAGIDYVRTLRAGGGTEMITGVRAALSTPAPEEFLRIVAFFTDGYIGNEGMILREAQRLLGPARVFSFGVGSSVNRYLLDRLAIIGRGKADYILLREKPDEAINRFIRRISEPVLTDISLNFSGIEVQDQTPSSIPDVFAGAPVYVLGRYDRPGEVEIEVLGRIGTSPSVAKILVDLPGPDPKRSPLPSIWAREQIKTLELVKLRTQNKGIIEEQITSLALQYQLMSAYTSFVAVDETPIEGYSGQTQFVPVSIPMPEGVCYEMTVQQRASPKATPQYAKPKRRSFRLPDISVGGGGPIGPLTAALTGVLAALERRRRKLRNGTGGRS